MITNQLLKTHCSSIFSIKFPPTFFCSGFPHTTNSQLILFFTMEKTLDKTVSIKAFLLTLSLIFISSIPLSLLRTSHSRFSLPFPFPSSLASSEKKCDVFSGKWMPYPQGPYYSNETCRLIVDQQNCMKFGRPDTEFMKWRWKPHDCELPLFDAAQFLEIVRGKSMAFVGDSVGRNQMESLVCLLAHVSWIGSTSGSGFLFLHN